MSRLKNIFLLALSVIFQSCLIRNSYSEAMHKKVRIGIVSLYDEGYKNIGCYSDINKAAYAQAHGYDLFLHHKTLDHTRPVAWSKILALQKHLNHYDWLFWSDADSLIMNQAISLETLIDDDFDIIISKEATLGNMNTGNFLIKNSLWSKKLLKDIYAQTALIYSCCWEQDALAYLLKINPALNQHIKLVHQRLINAHPYEPGGAYKEGDLLVHFYGAWGVSRWNKHSFMKDWYRITNSKVQ
jgi:galactosyl transferase GMA12/MNN10 family